MQQPPSQDPTNQSGQSWQPLLYPQSDQTMPPRPLPGNAPMQKYGQGEHPGEEAKYELVPQSPSGNYPAPYYPNPINPPKPPKRRNAMTIVVLILLALVIILGATTVLALRRSSGASTLSNTGGTAVATPLATPTGQPTPVPTATLAATVDTTPAATAPPAATMPSGTITENLLLTCGANCNDPIHVTITTVQVDDANGNMTWNISLKNVSGSSMGYGISTFELLASGTQTQIPATFSQSGGTLANSDPETTQGIFAFVPIQNTTYTLTVVVAENPYGGPNINFDPVQITNL